MSLSITDKEEDMRNKQLTYGSDIMLEKPPIHKNTLNDSVAESLDKIVLKKDSKKRISFLSICSLLISIIDFALYCIVSSGPSVNTPFWFVSVAANLWVPTSIIALLFPILAKWRRKLRDYNGRTLEIIALMIGSFDFYFVFFAISLTSLYICCAIIIICYVLYAKLFNKDEEIPEDKTYDIDNQEIPSLFKKKTSKNRIISENDISLQSSSKEVTLADLIEQKQNLEKELRALSKAPATTRNVNRCNEIMNQLKELELMKIKI